MKERSDVLPDESSDATDTDVVEEEDYPNLNQTPLTTKIMISPQLMMMHPLTESLWVLLPKRGVRLLLSLLMIRLLLLLLCVFVVTYQQFEIWSFLGFCVLFSEFLVFWCFFDFWFLFWIFVQSLPLMFDHSLWGSGYGNVFLFPTLCWVSMVP